MSAEPEHAHDYKDSYKLQPDAPSHQPLGRVCTTTPQHVEQTQQQYKRDSANGNANHDVGRKVGHGGSSGRPAAPHFGLANDFNSVGLAFRDNPILHAAAPARQGADAIPPKPYGRAGLV
jgi:hypothetical protein